MPNGNRASNIVASFVIVAIVAVIVISAIAVVAAAATDTIIICLKTSTQNRALYPLALTQCPVSSFVQ